MADPNAADATTLQGDWVPSERAQREVFDPYVIERLPLDSAEWRDRMKALERKWRFQRIRRRCLGWFPTGMKVPKWLRGRRTQEYIHDMYQRAYGGPPTTEGAVKKKPVPVAWQDEGYLVRRGAVPRVHLLFMAAIFERIRPVSVLEVGAGDGRNLLALSVRFPDIRWHGVELAAEGVAYVNRLQQDDAVPPSLADYIPWPATDPGAFRRVTMEVGNARSLPFASKSFDVVMTHLALEQMESIRAEALSEISRVARRHVLLVEPFADFNQTKLRRDFVSAKDYFSLSVAGLREFGIEPLHVTGAFPQNVRLGHGLVLGAMPLRS